MISRSFKRRAFLVVFLLFSAVVLPVMVYYVTRTVVDFRGRTSTPRTWTVCTSAGSGCDFIGGDGIQQAVYASSNGDTVLIKKGVYTREAGTPFTNFWGNTLSCFVSTMKTSTDHRSITIIGAGAVLDGSNSPPMEGICARGGTLNVKNLVIKGLKTQKGEGIQTLRGTGLLIEGDAQLYLANSVLTGNCRGVNAWLDSRATIVNTVFKDAYEADEIAHDGRAVVVDHNAVVSIAYSIMYNNEMGDFEVMEGCGDMTDGRRCQFTQGAGLKFEAPMLDAAYRPASGSPCVNTGDPTIKDPDNSVSDMGVYGGPNACGWDPDLDGCDECTPDCGGKECGDEDGCGGRCTNCPEGKTCSTTTWTCVDECVRNCEGKECGDDGCGGVCGACEWGEKCNASSSCEVDPACNKSTFIACGANSDCVKVTEGCCPCTQGGAEIAVNKNYQTKYEDCKNCPAGIVCAQSYVCQNVRPACVDSKCTLVEGDYSIADLDQDNDVDMTDYSLFVKDYLQYIDGGGLVERSDLDHNGKMSMNDYAVFVREYLDFNGLN